MGLCNRVAQMHDATSNEMLMVLVPSPLPQDFLSVQPVAHGNQESGR